MKKPVICGLDLGTFKICISYGSLDSREKIKILASEIVASQGVRQGKITDSRKLTNCIKQVHQQLRRKTGIRVKRVYANIDSLDLRTKTHQQVLSLDNNTVVKKGHLQSLLNQTVCSQIPLNRRLIHTGVGNFSLDDQNGSCDPEEVTGHIGRELKLNIAIISSLITTVNSYKKCIEDAGLIVQQLVPSASAQALCLFKETQADKQKVNILVDVGSELSKITLLKGSCVQDMLILPVGSQHITEQIAIQLRLSLDCAEQLKSKYGQIGLEAKSCVQTITLKNGLANRIIAPEGLSKVILSATEYILQEIKKNLLRFNYQNNAISEIIFSGGGCLLGGFLEKAERIFGKPVKMGLLYAVEDNYIQTQSAVFATSVGLVHFGFKHKRRPYFYQNARPNFFSQMFNQTKVLYQEYF